MGFWSGVGEAGSWVFDVFKAPVVGAKYTVQSLASCPAYAVGITDGGRCFYNYNRLSRQIWNSSKSVITSKGKNNPISKITEIVLRESKKNSPENYAKNILKFSVKFGVKKLTVDMAIKEMSNYMVGYIAARYFAGKTVSGVVSGSVTLGVGVALTSTSIANESFNAAMRLKHKNHVVYMKLFARNVECFWFLVESELKEFVYR